MKSRDAGSSAVVVTPPVLLGDDEVLDIDIAFQQLPELTLNVYFDKRNIARLEQDLQRLLQHLGIKVMDQQSRFIGSINLLTELA